MIWSNSAALKEIEYEMNQSSQKIFDEEITPLRNPLCLEQCLDLYTKQEIVHKECENCKKATSFEFDVKIKNLPNVLIIHLKRFCVEGGNCIQKIRKLVRFPIANLSMSKWSVDALSPEYDLYAVSNHISTTYSGGHYTSYILHEGSVDAESSFIRQWYEMNDDVVKTNTDKTVVTENAYILFYKRKSMKLSELLELDNRPYK